MSKAFSIHYRYSSITEKGSTLIALKHYSSSSIFHITMQLKQQSTKHPNISMLCKFQLKTNININTNICTMKAYSKKI